MRALLIALGLIFSATLATADISWKLDRFGAGSVMVLKDRSGALTHVKRGTTTDAHIFDVYAGATTSGAYLGMYETNARGDVTATVAVDGAVTRFVPHRCSRTLGTCQFTVIHSDGFQEPRSRVTRATRNGLRYQEFGLDGLMSEGEIKLDANGASKGGWKKNPETGKSKVRTRRIMIAMN